MRNLFKRTKKSRPPVLNINLSEIDRAEWNEDCTWSKTDRTILDSFLTCDTGRKLMLILKKRILDYSITMEFDQNDNYIRRGMVVFSNELYRLAQPLTEREAAEDYGFSDQYLPDD